jgi:glutathione peroxidase
MNRVTVLFSLLLVPFVARDFYTIQFPDAAGKNVTMSTFKGKKVIVAVINAKSPDISYLRYLNQLQGKSSNLQIIAVPSTDFAGLSDPTRIDQVKSSEKLSIIMAKPGELRKDAKSMQHPLLEWLTSKEQNQHFDLDIEATDKLFFINESGILYGILEYEAGPEVIANTLKQVIR